MSGGEPACGEVQVEVVTRSGRASSVRFIVGARTVEVWHRGVRCGVLDRDELAAWLRSPRRPIRDHDVELSLGERADPPTGAIAISLPDVWVWALSPADEIRLAERVLRPI